MSTAISESFEFDDWGSMAASPLEDLTAKIVGWVSLANGWSLGDYGTRIFKSSWNSVTSEVYWGDDGTNAAIRNGQLVLSAITLGGQKGISASPAWKKLENVDYSDPYGYVYAFAQTPSITADKIEFDYSISDESYYLEPGRPAEASVTYKTRNGEQTLLLSGSGKASIDLDPDIPTPLFIQLKGVIGQQSYSLTNAYLALDNFLASKNETPIDLNDAPTGLTLSASSIDENSPAGSVVATLSTTDRDATDSFTYSLVSGAGDSDNAAFSIDGNRLLINNPPDFETKSSYSLRIRSTDQGGLSFERAVTLTVNDLNEAPTGWPVISTPIPRGGLNQLWLSQSASDTSFQASAKLNGATYAFGESNGGIYIEVISSTGATEWKKTLLSGTGTKVNDVEAYGNNFYIVGQTAGLVGSSQYGGTDAFIANLNSNGELVWIKQFGAPAGTATSTPLNEKTFDSARSIVIDSSGYAYISGVSREIRTMVSVGGRNYGNLSNTFIRKIDPSGNTVWETAANANSWLYHDDSPAIALDEARGQVIMSTAVQMNPSHLDGLIRAC